MGLLDKAVGLATASSQQKMSEATGAAVRSGGSGFTKTSTQSSGSAKSSDLQRQNAQKAVESAERVLAEMDKTIALTKPLVDSGEFSEMQFRQFLVDRAAAAEKLKERQASLAALGGKEAEEKVEAAEASVSATTVNAVVDNKRNQENHLVTLTEPGGAVVPFIVLPEVVESHTNQYEAIAPAQFPGAFQKYKGTDSTQWTLNITLIARTPKEATDNYRILNTLRGWKKPFFGDNSGRAFPGKLGAPPPVLTLKGLRGLIGPVPVVLVSLNWNWPKDVDYIPTTEKAVDGNFIPFPTVIDLAIQLVESYSTQQFNNFDLSKYRTGKLSDAFSTPPVYGDENFDSRKYDVREAGAGQSSAAFAAQDPRRIDLPSAGVGAGGGQSSSAFAAIDPRRLDLKGAANTAAEEAKSKVSPIANKAAAIIDRSKRQG